MWCFAVLFYLRRKLEKTWLQCSRRAKPRDTGNYNYILCSLFLISTNSSTAFSIIISTLSIVSFLLVRFVLDMYILYPNIHHIRRQRTTVT